MFNSDDNISLKPCKGSLQNLISVYGDKYHKSPEFQLALEQANEKCERRKQGLMTYLYENEIDFPVSSDMIYEWDGSEQAKENINKYWEQYRMTKIIVGLSDNTINILTETVDSPTAIEHTENTENILGNTSKPQEIVNNTDENSEDGFEVVVSKKKNKNLHL
jgi:hypothetical protein